MPDRCPYLDYRQERGEHSFDTARPYCTAVEEFVQPMRADICAGRYGLDHATDCEIYLAHAGGPGKSGKGDGANESGSDGE